MEFEMTPQTVEYEDSVKTRVSGTEVDVARGGWCVDEDRERKVEDLWAGCREVVEERKGGRVCKQRVTHKHERFHSWKISIERAKYQS